MSQNPKQRKLELEKIKQDSRIIRWYELVKNIADHLVEMGQLLVSLRQDIPNIYDVLMEESGFSQELLDSIYNVGLGAPRELALRTDEVAVCIKGFPIDMQKSLLSDRFPVVTSGTPETKLIQEHKRFAEMTPKERKQVFDGHRERSPVEQYHYMQRQKPAEKKAFVANAKGFRLTSRKSVSWQELAQILTQTEVRDFLKPYGVFTRPVETKKKS